MDPKQELITTEQLIETLLAEGIHVPSIAINRFEKRGWVQKVKVDVSPYGIGRSNYFNKNVLWTVRFIYLNKGKGLNTKQIDKLLKETKIEEQKELVLGESKGFELQAAYHKKTLSPPKPILMDEVSSDLRACSEVIRDLKELRGRENRLFREAVELSEESFYILQVLEKQFEHLREGLERR